MKIALIKPPSKIPLTLPPTGLCYLVSYIKSKKIDVDISILDCLKGCYDYDKFKKYIEDEKPDIVGFTAMTAEINSVLLCAKICKGINKSTIIIIGGSHVSNDPESVLMDKNVDFVFRGDVEDSFYRLILNLKKNKLIFDNIPNLGYKKNNELILNPIVFNEDLDSLPFPNFDLVNPKEYPKCYFSKKHPTYPILTSRGCPYSCTFCTGNRIYGKKFRYRSPENIIKELKLAKEKYGIREFQILDDNFTLIKERVMKFCDLLEKEDINLDWWCPNGLRVETLDFELIKRMKETGCYAMVFGIESGSERIQKDMKKNLDFKKLREVIAICHKLKIRTQAGFIIGYPTETREDILKSIRLAKNLKLSRASFLLFQPLVGSEIYYKLKNEGKLPRIDYSKCDYSTPTVLSQGFKNKKELKNIQRRAIFSFYLRPQVFFRFLLENLHPDQIKDLFLLIKRYTLR